MNLNKCKPHQQEYWLLVDCSASYCVQRSVLELAKGLQQFAMPVRVILLSRLGKEPFLEQHLIQFGLAYGYLDDLYYLTGSHSTLSQWRKLLIVYQHFYPKILHSHDHNANLLSKFVKMAIKAQLSLKKSTLNSILQPVKLICSTYSKESNTAPNIDIIDRSCSFLANSNLSSSFANTNTASSSHLMHNDFVMPHSFHKSKGDNIAFIGKPSVYWKNEIEFTKQVLPNNTLVHCVTSPQKNHKPTKLLSCFPEDLKWPHIGLMIIHIDEHIDVLLALEAMARQIPVIAIKNTLADKLIKNNKCGWITTKDSVNTCIKQWSQLSKSDKAYMQKEAKQNIVEHFSSLKVVPKILSVYQTVD